MLDFGWGDATTAIPMAKLGANVLGVDIADDLVRQCKLKYNFSLRLYGLNITGDRYI